MVFSVSLSYSRFFLWYIRIFVPINIVLSPNNGCPIFQVKTLKKSLLSRLSIPVIWINLFFTLIWGLYSAHHLSQDNVLHAAFTIWITISVPPLCLVIIAMFRTERDMVLLMNLMLDYERNQLKMGPQF